MMRDHTERGARPAPHIDAARCTGCGWCVAACLPRALSLQTEGWRKTAALHDAPGCTGCAQCALRCPCGAIRMAGSMVLIADDNC
jgi:ferredoxin